MRYRYEDEAKLAELRAGWPGPWVWDPKGCTWDQGLLGVWREGDDFLTGPAHWVAAWSDTSNHLARAATPAELRARVAEVAEALRAAVRAETPPARRGGSDAEGADR